ncbi:MAG: hypothetical protein AAGF27_04380 [Pseudomonadota bacterium]
MVTRLFLAAVIATSLAAPVAAQGFLQQLERTGLTQEDINIMVERGSTLYRSGGAQVGSDTVWQNVQTGAYGLAEITEVEGTCVRIAYRFITTRRNTLQTILVRRCLQDGRWRLSD